jgi:DNA polymerase-3 subunit alpha
MSFAHLHTHNEYSLLDGLGTAEQYILKAKELNQKYLALTNHGNVDGLIKFQKEADKQKINPVLGCEAYIVKSLYVKEKGEHRDHVTLLIQNEIGFQNLCKMLTKANLDGFYYKPRIDFELLYDHCEGLVILTGCSSSFLNIEGAEVFLSQLKKKLKDDIYLELMPHNFKEQKEHNKYCLKLSKKYKIDIVGTNDCHYINAEDEKTQQVLLAIQTQAKWNDENRFKFNTKGLFLCSEKQMASKFEHQGVLNKEQIEKCLSNTIEIAKKCSGFRIKKQGIFLPVVPKYKNENPKELLEQLVNEKLYTIFKKEKFTAEKRREYKSRVLLELDLIEKKGFIPYFLIIKELVDWCADNDIMIGCGRGSVGGCLVAYCLGITSIDSIKYNLLFSRFIADDRQDAPDIDIDFMDSKRELVRQHLEELYGKNNIASISTFLSMKGKAAIRDVARVFDLPLKEVDTFAKTISYYDDNSIEDACKTDEGKLFKKKYPEVITHALKLEGQIKANGSHAAAVIISADDLTQGTKGNLCKRSDTIVSNWDMEDSEYIGLMKLDVLGLSTLSVLDEVKKTVLENHGKKIIFDEIPLDDKKVYEQISAGNNVGVFQITAYSTNKLAQRLKADNIFLLSDLISLVRPGVADSGMTDLFLERKNGDEWEKKNDIFEEITKDTYGVLCIEENTKISLSSGIDIPINEVKKGDKLLSVNKDNKIESKICDGCAKTRIGNGYSITLSNNYSIILTGDHKVLTYYGMKEVSELSSNDLIASSYCLPSFVRRKKKNHI